MATDRLTISGLTYKAKHGVFEQEKLHGNTFKVSLEFILDLSTAAKNDSLTETIDYVKAEEIVATVMMGDSADLIETLTFKIGELLFAEFSHIRQLTVSVRKLHPPMSSSPEYSEVTMSWPR